MKILFQAPSFSSPNQKNELLEQLHKLPAFVGCEEMNTHLLLELNSETIEFESIRQLSQIFDQWGIDQSPLESLYQLMGIEGYQPE